MAALRELLHWALWYRNQCRQLMYERDLARWWLNDCKGPAPVFQQWDWRDQMHENHLRGQAGLDPIR